MHKNGKFFVSVIAREDFIPAVWDPFAYRIRGDSQTLGEFAAVERIAERASDRPETFEPIEYRDVPGGAYLSFVLRRRKQRSASKFPTVGEKKLLFGTMRAYLGNVIVTPRAEWINETSPLRFQVKSEFVLVTPHDRLTYFWLAYLRSNHFLSHLPLGHGGTRPRLQPKALVETPVAVPEVYVREQINNELEQLAKSEWLTYFRAALLNVSVVDESHDTNANPSNRNYTART